MAPSATSASISARISPGRRSFSLPRSDGHDAERAGVVAADRDGDPAAVGGLAPGGEGRGEDLERFEDLELGLAVVAGALEERRQRAHVVGAEDDVDPGRLLEDDRLVFLGEAAADGDLHALVLALRAREVSEGAVELVVGVLAHGAGVDDDDVGVAVGRPDVPGGLEGAAQPLRVVHVHLAAEGAHLVGARGGVQARFRAGVEQRHGADSLRRTTSRRNSSGDPLAEPDRARRSGRQRLVDRRADRAARVAASGQVGSSGVGPRRRGRANRADCARLRASSLARASSSPVSTSSSAYSIAVGASRRRVSSAAIAVRPSPLRSWRVRDQGLREGEVVDEPDPRRGARSRPRSSSSSMLAVAQRALELALRQPATGERLQARRCCGTGAAS